MLSLRISASFVLVAAFLASMEVGAQQNTGCYNYYKQKDNCVSATASSACAAKTVTTTIDMIFPPTDLSAYAPTGPTPASPSTPAPAAPAAPAAPVPASTLGGTAPRQRRQVANSSAVSVITPATLVPAPPLPVGGAPAGPSAPAAPVSTGALFTPTDSICGPFNAATDLGVCLWSGSDILGLDPARSGWVSLSATQNCKKEVTIQRAGGAPIVAKVLDGCSFDATTPAAGCNQLFLTKAAFTALTPTPQELATGVISGLTWDFNSKTNAANIPV